MSFEIMCSTCGRPTGAWFEGGDPYLPSIVCTDCHEGDCTCGYGGFHEPLNERCERNRRALNS